MKNLFKEFSFQISEMNCCFFYSFFVRYSLCVWGGDSFWVLILAFIFVIDFVGVCFLFCFYLFIFSFVLLLS